MVKLKVVNKMSITTQQYALIVARAIALRPNKSDRFIKNKVTEFISFYNEFTEGGISKKAMEYYQQNWLLGADNTQAIRLINEKSDYKIDENGLIFLVTGVYPRNLLIPAKLTQLV